jgi:N-acetylmuramoyl-L-alanine amidase
MRERAYWALKFAGGILAISFIFIIVGNDGIQNTAGWISRGAQSAAVFFVPSISIQNNYHGLQSKDLALGPTGQSSGAGYSPNAKVRVLIVPGHQPQDGGTVFNGVYERYVVVDIADRLAELLKHNSHYDVMVARSKTTWNPVLRSYFDSNAAEIDAFRQVQTLQMESHIALGNIEPEPDHMYHNTASSLAVSELYGINKWASENKYDITLHLHLNDYPGRHGSAGKYDGFAVYVPHRQYSNAAASKALGEAIAARLNKYHATSTLPKEDKGIIEDQELIAVGSNNTADGAALLLEYGYIHEPQFQKTSIRTIAIADYAYQTYLGLQDFFNDTPEETSGSAAFPYDWDTVKMSEELSGPDIYALQSALHYLGYYPKPGKSFSDCPVSGVFGPCTRSAVVAYQETRGLPATGFVGPLTLSELEKDVTAIQ